MFEKEAEEYEKMKHYRYEDNDYCGDIADGIIQAYQKGAEFGYNKANEWHFVKDGDYPKKKGIYLVAWERTHHVEEYGEWGFDVDVFNADDGYFEGCGDFVIAWKEILLWKEN